MNNAKKYNVEPFFLPFGSESIFCVYMSPEAKKPQAGILYLHPFAEEMHKSRRVAAQQARKFAMDGYAVLLIDLLGCGDSTGDFEDANWDAWKDCVYEGYNWLSKKIDTPIILWGLRLGATLAAEISTQLPDISGLVLWQPVANGEIYLNQLLRLKLASQMLDTDQSKSGTKNFRNLLMSGESIEIGGNMISSTLALAIDKLSLLQITIRYPVYWFEFSQYSSISLSPTSIKVVEYWASLGGVVFTSLITGESFWSSQEICDCPDLYIQTTNVISKIINEL